MKKHFIPQNLKFLRRQLGLTQEKISDNFLQKHIPINRSRYEGFENGRNEPNIDLIKDLSSFFGLSIEDFCFTDLTKQIPMQDHPFFECESKGNCKAPGCYCKPNDNYPYR